MNSEKRYINVILPLPLKGTFTYFTYLDNLLIGQRVVVQFGVRKLYSAIINTIHSNKPINYKAKEVLAIIDEDPVVNIIQLNFWSWISEYYMCNLGDVMNAALPFSLKLVSESSIVVHNNFDGELNELSLDELNLINLLSTESELKISEIAKLLKVKNIFSFINELIRKEVVEIKENLHDKYKQKVIQIIKLVSTNNQTKKIKLTTKQAAFVEAYETLNTKFPKKKWTTSQLLNQINFSRSILSALVRKNVFKIEKQNTSRLSHQINVLKGKKLLENFQSIALKEIIKAFVKKDVCLLHGITSSGKTELYIKLIEEQLKKGKTVLYLLPEIALTTQIIRRLQEQFGDKVGITHSRLNNGERVEVWNAVNGNNFNNIEYPIILGARSSLFLPFNNLGLIIVDEEHDSSFKQSQVSPRYNARDSAIYLAKLHHAKVLLGSATPSLESYYNANKGKYALVEMKTRYKGINLPHIQTIDIRKAHLKKEMVDHFSTKLLEEIEICLASKKQVILFQNRRGYSPILSCNSCGYTPHCKHCDVSLTFYKFYNHLKCHFCGYTQKILDDCSNCSSKDFKNIGFGTEQIEESLKLLFPSKSIKRMDYDSTRGKNAYEMIINDFEQARIDILVGTQMITKGLDFDNVALVGILNADKMLHFPDFRSYEKAFQLMMQVAGRAGRKSKQGKVFVQTFDEEHEIFNLLKNNDFNSFVINQAHERKLFNYPPYCKLIAIKLRNKSQMKLDASALYLSSMMKNSFKDRVLGPEYPVVSRVKNYYIKNIILKIERQSSIIQAKVILNKIIENMLDCNEFKSTRVSIDVDPD